MQMYKNYISPLGYQMGNNRIDSYGVNHSGFNTHDDLYYNLARQKRENALIGQYNSQGMTKNYPQLGTNFWGVPANNNYGFGNSNIVGTVEPMLKNPLANPPLNQGVQYAQNNLPSMANDMNQNNDISTPFSGYTSKRDYSNRYRNSGTASDIVYNTISNFKISPNPKIVNTNNKLVDFLANQLLSRLPYINPYNIGQTLGNASANIHNAINEARKK